MKLVFHTVNDGVLEFDIPRSSVLIGRGSMCDVVLKTEGISRQHCRIDVSGSGDISITDLGSTNGVLIDNIRIPANEPQPFKTFMPLAIGSVPMVTIETSAVIHKEREIVSKNQNISIELDLPQKNKKNRGQAAARPSKNIQTQVDKAPPWGLLLGALAAIAAITYFFFLN